MNNPENKTQDEDKQSKKKHNTICPGHHYEQANTTNVNKTNNSR